MIKLSRRQVLLSAAAVPLAGCSVSNVPDDPMASRLAAFHVRDPGAGYVDSGYRRKILRVSRDPVLMALRDTLLKGVDCHEISKIPVQDGQITLPTFYGDNAGWRQAVKPFWAIERAVAKLASANLVAPDRRFADCLISVLLKWARRDAMMDFTFENKNKQAWFQIEATLFTMALALSAVRRDVPHRSADLEFIDDWLVRTAYNHYAIKGGEGGTCCNNHFYRRALYATIIGVMAQDDFLFRQGVKAVLTALDGALPDGALPLEMARGDRAAHYQNYALNYLVPIAQIIERQGYPVWNMSFGGSSLHALIAFNNSVLMNPETVLQHANTQEIYLDYLEDDQYFAWFEIYLSKFRSAFMETWAARRRPLFNRTLGGNLTAFFYRDLHAEQRLAAAGSQSAPP